MTTQTEKAEESRHLMEILIQHAKVFENRGPSTWNNGVNDYGQLIGSGWGENRIIDVNGNPVTLELVGGIYLPGETPRSWERGIIDVPSTVKNISNHPKELQRLINENSPHEAEFYILEGIGFASGDHDYSILRMPHYSKEQKLEKYLHIRFEKPQQLAKQRGYGGLVKIIVNYLRALTPSEMSPKMEPHIESPHISKMWGAGRLPGEDFI